jgi:glycosyltransferase involved in cell wall biosynthesis
LRILFVTHELGTGGAEKLTVGYALGMAARGHEAAVAFSYRDSQAGPLREAQIELFRLYEPGLRPATFVPWVRRLRTAVRAFRPDVIHAQGVATATAARLADVRVPLLVTLHGISKSDEAVAALLFRAIGAHMTAVSETAATGLLRHRWAPHVDILGPGIDVEQLTHQAGSLRPADLVGDPAVVCVARQHLAKGVDVLLRAFPEVLRSYPGAGLTLVGDGPELPANRQLMAELGLEGRAAFVGLIPFAAPYLRAASAVVLPSRREGLPIVVLEALALERPVVATAVGGTPTVVLDGETGWLVPPEDPAALAGAIVACLGDEAEAARRARAGRDLVEKVFSSGPMLDRVEELLQGLVTTSRRTRAR